MGSRLSSPSRSSSSAVGNGASRRERAARETRGCERARCAHASANSRWMRGRRWAAAPAAVLPSCRRARGTRLLPSTAMMGASARRASPPIWVGDDEAGEVVGNHDDGALGEPGDEASALSRLRLDEGPVGETESGGCGEVVAHPFEHETVQAGARPGIVEAKALVDHEGFATLLGVTESAVEGVVALQAAIRLHPVQDVVARPTAPASSRVAGTDFRVAHDLIVPRATMAEP